MPMFVRLPPRQPDNNPWEDFAGEDKKPRPVHAGAGPLFLALGGGRYRQSVFLFSSARRNLFSIGYSGDGMMSLLDGILKNIGGAPDDVANLAAKVGLDPALVEKAIGVLGQTHQMQGDTVDLAAAKTGIDAGALSSIVEHIGGEGSLTKFAGMLDQDGDGNPLNDIAGMAGKLFGKK